MSETNIAPKGRELVKTWQDAEERVERANAELRQANRAEHDAKKALAVWLLPKDYKSGEKIGVWERDKHDNEVFFEAMILPCGSHSVVKRYRS
jgi:hypothetical protein